MNCIPGGVYICYLYYLYVEREVIELQEWVRKQDQSLKAVAEARIQRGAELNISHYKCWVYLVNHQNDFAELFHHSASLGFLCSGPR